MNCDKESDNPRNYNICFLDGFINDYGQTEG